MADRNMGRRKRVVDRIADAALPKPDETNASGRPLWWWVFVMPGKVILWIQYMFPERLAGVFGSARRRNVQLIQILYSVYFYVGVVVLFIIFFLTFGAPHPKP